MKLIFIVGVHGRSFCPNEIQSLFQFLTKDQSTQREVFNNYYNDHTINMEYDEEGLYWDKWDMWDTTATKILRYRRIITLFIQEQIFGESKGEERSRERENVLCILFCIFTKMVYSITHIVVVLISYFL